MITLRLVALAVDGLTATGPAVDGLTATGPAVDGLTVTGPAVDGLTVINPAVGGLAVGVSHRVSLPANSIAYTDHNVPGGLRFLPSPESEASDSSAGCQA
ncbi:MAG: hypothetical protein OXC00_02615 [Acidimicrobiaceae bacterium]|nr:hypothetical protein [Acidimicrobiaceae bacterium]